MKLFQIYLYRYNKPFSFKFTSAHLTRVSADSIIVRLVYDNGIEGYGECAPRSYVTGEDAESVARQFETTFIPILFSSPLNSLEDVHSILAQLEEESFRSKKRKINAALCAIELALLDAAAKLSNVSIPALMGMESKEPVPRSISIPIMPTEQFKRIYLSLGQPALQHVKILVDNDIAETQEKISIVRELLGEQVSIRLEVNERWTFSEAVSIIELLEKYNIFAIEQPLHRRYLYQLRTLKMLSPIPIILDESVCSLEEAKAHIEENACDIINIKLSKCGGILKAKRIVDYAYSNDVKCQLGSHVGESPILFAAGEIFSYITHSLLFNENFSDLLFSTNGRVLIRIDLVKEWIDEGKGLGVPEAILRKICRDSNLLSLRQG
jgi:muconate cycloisomerase